MTTQLIENIKRISMDAQNADEPISIVYGNVIKEAPVEIIVGQKMILDEKRLIFMEWARKTDVKAEVSWQSEVTEDHSHRIEGEKTITFDNSLKNGDKVIMLKMQGGQKYIVLGRTVKD